MNNNLVISALGNDKPGIVNELTKTILNQGGNILESRMSVLGGEFAMMLLVSGSEDCINNVLSKLEETGEQLNLTLLAKETQATEKNINHIPYTVKVVSMDHPGIVHHISDFFAGKNINIEDIETNTYPAAHTGTSMFSLNMTMSIPADSSVKNLRDEFLVFCDDLNLDASLENKR